MSNVIVRMILPTACYSNRGRDRGQNGDDDLDDVLNGFLFHRPSPNPFLKRMGRDYSWGRGGFNGLRVKGFGLTVNGFGLNRFSA